MKNALSILLMLALLLSLGAAAFASDADIEETGDSSLDVNVSYTYSAPENVAAKTFSVTLEYSFPTAATVSGGNTEYIWNAKAGKYVAGEPGGQTVGLADGGKFSITITNQSNVSIDYTVTYTTNTDSIFVNALSGSMANAFGTLDTVADGQTVNEDGSISIDDLEKATAGSTEFDSAECTGALAISAVREGTTIAASGGNIRLGTFTVTIAEAVAEEAYDGPASMTIAEAFATIDGGLPIYDEPWSDGAKNLYVSAEHVILNITGGNSQKSQLSTAAGAERGEGNTYVAVIAAGGDNSFTGTIILNMSAGGVLQSVTIQGSENGAYDGTYAAPSN